MAEEKQQHNFGYIAIVAIVAIVAIIVLVVGSNKSLMMSAPLENQGEGGAISTIGGGGTLASSGEPDRCCGKTCQPSNVGCIFEQCSTTECRQMNPPKCKSSTTPVTCPDGSKGSYCIDTQTSNCNLR